MKLKVSEVARRNKRWSLTRLATELDIDPQTVMYWNQGRSYPRFPMLLRMLELLGCKLEDLI